jgi:DoxX-like family
MRQYLATMSVHRLRWVLGLVVFLESLHFAVSAAAAHHFARTGMPLWIRPMLGWSEAAAALLFLLPLTMVVGGYLLLLTFALAAAIHFYGGDFGMGALIVYRTVVMFCISYPEKKSGRTPACT